MPAPCWLLWLVAGELGTMGGRMSAKHVDERPDTVYLVEWTDIFDTKRMALSLQRKDVESFRQYDPEASITEGKVEWDEQI